MSFKTTATFNGKKMHELCPIFVALDLGDGVKPYGGWCTEIDETKGVADCELLGRYNVPANIFDGADVGFDATADAAGDPYAMTVSGTWMFAEHADIS